MKDWMYGLARKWIAFSGAACVFLFLTGIAPAQDLGAPLPVDSSGQFGFAVSPIHDWDLDGVHDLCVSSPAISEMAACRIVSGSDGTPLARLDLDPRLSKNLGISRFGIRVLSVADYDKDEVPDVAVLARGGTGFVVFIMDGREGSVLRVIDGWKAPIRPPALGDYIACSAEEKIALLWQPVNDGGVSGRIVLGAREEDWGEGFVLQWTEMPACEGVVSRRIGLAHKPGNQSLALVGDFTGDEIPDIAAVGMKDIAGRRLLCLFSSQDMEAVYWQAFDPKLVPPLEGVISLPRHEGEVLLFGRTAFPGRQVDGDRSRYRLVRFDLHEHNIATLSSASLADAQTPEFGSDLVLLNLDRKTSALRLAVASPFANSVSLIVEGLDGVCREIDRLPRKREDFANQLSAIGDCNRDGCVDFAVTSACRGFRNGVVDVFSGADGDFLFEIPWE